jgi:ATP-dependent helicase STH1/SNF2
LAEPFLTLPSRRGFPDYFRVIKNPISFNEIQKKKYTDMEVLKKDVLLIFSNCKIYNQPGSIIFQDAADLEVFDFKIGSISRSLS